MTSIGGVAMDGLARVGVSLNTVSGSAPIVITAGLSHSIAAAPIGPKAAAEHVRHVIEVLMMLDPHATLRLVDELMTMTHVPHPPAG